MKAQPDYSIYLVTDDGCLQGRALIDCVREALEGGVTLVQYRAKTASSSGDVRRSAAAESTVRQL